MDNSKIKTVILIVVSVLCVVLCAAFAITGISYYNYKQTAVRTNTDPSSEPADDAAAPVTASTIDMETFKKNAQEFNLSTEFVQRFFTDTIVYKDTQGIVYSPIDATLPKNSYNWNNLAYNNNQIQYIEGGMSKALKGIDVSKHQLKINWSKVKNDGVDFAIIRLGVRGYGTGKLVLDDNFHTNMKEAINAGIKVGVYFYSQAITNEEVLEEAAMVLKEIKGYDVTYPVIFDMEEVLEDEVRTKDLTTVQRTDMTIAFCDTIKAAGYTPMVYANIKWFVAKLDMSRLTQYDKWFAQYYQQPFFPYEFQMWQYTSKGKVDGIDGNVDLNISFKDYSKPDVPISIPVSNEVTSSGAS